MKIDVLMLGSDASPITKNKDAIVSHVIKILQKHWGRILVIVPHTQRGFHFYTKDIVYYTTPSYLSYILTMFFISKYISKPKFIVSQDVFFYGISGSIVKTLSSSPLICEIHSDFFLNQKWLNLQIKNKIYFLIGFMVMLIATFIRPVHITPYLKKYFGKKIIYAPSNYINERFRNINKKRDIDLLYIGRFHKHKNIPYLIKLLNKILAQHPFKVLLIISPDKEQIYEKHIRTLTQIYPSIKYHSYVPYTEINKIYNSSKVLIITSINEGNPRVAFEALKCGCLVCTTPTGKIYEFLTQNPACGVVLTENVDDDAIKIISLLKNYNKLSKKCIKNIKFKTFEESVEHYAKSYLKVVGGSNVHTP